MSATFFGRARLIFGVMAVAAFSALVLVGCMKDNNNPTGGGGGLRPGTDPNTNPGTDPGTNPGTNPNTGGNLVLGANEAWIATEDGERMGFIFKSNGDLVSIYETGYNSWYGEEGRWSTSGSNITLTMYGEPMSGTYSIAGNSLTITIGGYPIRFTKTGGITNITY